MATLGTAFASDFDGTLCQSNWVTGEQHFDPANLDAIRRYQADGGLFGICTGRPLASVLESLEGLLTLDFYIVTTGSQVLDRDLNKLWERSIARDIAEELVERYASPQSAVVTVTDDQFVAVRYPMGPNLPVVASLDEVPDTLLDVSIECAGDQEAARAICAEVNERYAGTLEGFQNLGSVDIVPAGCSKGAGVDVVRKSLGVSSIAGIGDSYNDLPLLAAADVAYTFDASPEEVRSAADVVVATLAYAVADFRARP